MQYMILDGLSTSRQINIAAQQEITCSTFYIEMTTVYVQVFVFQWIIYCVCGNVNILNSLLIVNMSVVVHSR